MALLRGSFFFRGMSGLTVRDPAARRAMWPVLCRQQQVCLAATVD